MKRQTLGFLVVFAIHPLTSGIVATGAILSGGTEVKVSLGYEAISDSKITSFGSPARITVRASGWPDGMGLLSTATAEGLNSLQSTGGVGKSTISTTRPDQYPWSVGTVHVESNAFVEFSSDAAGMFFARGAKSAHPFGARLGAWIYWRDYSQQGVVSYEWSHYSDNLATMSFSYTPGRIYTVYLHNGIDTAGAMGPTTSFSGTWIWGFNSLPGQGAANPLSVGNAIGTADIPDTSIPDPETEPTAVTGGYLTGLPVEGDYGRTAPIYVGEAPSGSPAPPAEAARGYGFVSQGLRINSFIIPAALPGGDSEFEVLVGGLRYPAAAGSVFDFTTLASTATTFAALADATNLYPDGVESFAILGIDPAEGLDPTAPLPFPVGLQFNGDGLTQLYTLTYGPVPEPTALAMWALGLLALTPAARRRK